MGRPRKVLTKEQILNALSRVKSHRAAARYLHVSYNHYKKYARLYKDEESGLTVLEKHKNQAGRGIPKFKKGKSSEPLLLDILEGRVPHEHFTPQRIKERIIMEGLIEEKCHQCDMTERRVLDLRMPLILHFKDGDKKNFGLNNLDFLCYNCYFLYVGNVFSGKEIVAMEDYHDGGNTKEPDWELDEHMKEHLKEIGLYNEDDEDKEDGSEFVSYS